MREGNTIEHNGPKTEADMVRFFVRWGKWVLVAGIVALAGLVVTYSGDATIASLGWSIFYAGILIVLLLMDFVIARTALWSWRERKFVAGFLVLVTFLVATVTIVVAFFLNSPSVRDALFYLAVLVGLPAPFVQALQERRRKALVGSPSEIRPP